MIHSTGTKERRCDAIAMNLWPSRGQTLIGLELKQSRSDFLREIRDPAKAEMFASILDEWWIVTTNGIVNDASEIPETWGWLEETKTGGKLRVKQKAKRKTGAERRDPPRSIFASMVRRAQEGASRTDLRLAEQKGLDEGLRQGQRANRERHEIRVRDSEITALKRELEAYREAIKEAGMSFESWAYPSIGRAVKLIHDVGTPRLIGQITRMGDDLRRTSDGLQAALARYRNEED